MSLVDVIRDALERDMRVDILDECNDFARNNSMFQVWFWVAPTQGSYTRKELQAFMMSLVPDITPTYINPFVVGTLQEPKNPEYMFFGSLQYKEKVGEIVSTVNIENEALGEFIKSGNPSFGDRTYANIELCTQIIVLPSRAYYESSRARERVMVPMDTLNKMDPNYPSSLRGRIASIFRLH